MFGKFEGLRPMPPTPFASGVCIGAGCKAAGCRVAGCRAASCRGEGCKGCATGCRVDMGSLRKGAETLYCCILGLKIRYASRAPAVATNET